MRFTRMCRLEAVVRLLLVCIIGGTAATANATGITADAGLTPPEDRWIFRSQIRYMENDDVDDAQHRILSEEDLNGRPCWVIESIPNPDGESEYSKLTSWVDKAEFIPYKVEFDDKKGYFSSRCRASNTH